MDKSEYSTFFNIEQGNDSNSECIATTYKIVQKEGDNFIDVPEDPLIQLTDDKIFISRLLTTVEPVTYYIQATTLGKVVARKEISITTPCSFDVVPIENGPSIVLPYEEGKSVSTYDLIMT